MNRVEEYRNLAKANPRDKFISICDYSFLVGMQYNNQAHLWSANARFGWLGTAGTGLYVVYNDGEVADGYFNWGQPQTRSFIVKYTRQIGAP